MHPASRSSAGTQEREGLITLAEVFGVRTESEMREVAPRGDRPQSRRLSSYGRVGGLR